MSYSAQPPTLTAPELWGNLDGGRPGRSRRITGREAAWRNDHRSRSRECRLSFDATKLIEARESRLYHAIIEHSPVTDSPRSASIVVLILPHFGSLVPQADDATLAVEPNTA